MLAIQPLALQPNSDYVFSLSFQNFAGIPGSASFQILTSGYTSIAVAIQQDQVFQFKNWRSNKFQANFEYLSCQSGTVQQLQQPLDCEWLRNNSLNVQTSLNQSTTTPTQTFILYSLSAYTHAPGETYKMQIRCYDPLDPAIVGKSTVQYTIDITPLVVYIKGGSRMQAYSKSLQMEGVAKDLDVQPDQQTLGIDLNWTCINIVTNGPCRGIQGDEVQLNQTNSL